MRVSLSYSTDTGYQTWCARGTSQPNLSVNGVDVGNVLWIRGISVDQFIRRGSKESTNLRMIGRHIVECLMDTALDISKCLFGSSQFLSDTAKIREFEGCEVDHGLGVGTCRPAIEILVGCGSDDDVPDGAGSASAPD